MQTNVTDQLRDAFQDLAEALEPIVEQLEITKPSDAIQIRSAKERLVSAAEQLNALSLDSLFAGNSDLSKLQLLADEINAKADVIAAQERNVARIAGIAAGALSIVSAVRIGNVADVLTAVKNVTSILD